MSKAETNMNKGGKAERERVKAQRVMLTNVCQKE